jgi:hypothetical protein
MSEHTISIIPTYTEDGSLIVMVFDKLDGTPIESDEFADALMSYAALLRSPDEDDLAN